MLSADALKKWSATGLLAVLSAGIGGVPAFAQNSAGINGVTLQGTLGGIRIGMALQINNLNVVERAHYFYARSLRDIPLTGNVDGSTVRLHEAGGGSFILKFRGNGSEGGRALNLSNSVGLDGTWSDGTQSLPVRLDFESRWDSAPGLRWYANLTDESDAAFEARVRGFRTSVLKGDREAAAKYVDFPLRVNYPRTHVVRSAAQLSAEWDEIFTPVFVKALRATIPHDMFVHNGQAMLGDGLVWFNATGATAINPPRQENSH
jgi:hypothetical protein